MLSTNCNKLSKKRHDSFFIFTFAIEQKHPKMEYEENDNPGSMAAEPSAALYYGSSIKLRESGIIPELSHLDKSDTLWIIRFLQLHLEQMIAKEKNDYEPDIDPMFGLDFLKNIHEGLPDFEDLRTEYFQDKYGIAL